MEEVEIQENVTPQTSEANSKLEKKVHQKIKLTLDEIPDHPLFLFLEEMKHRKIKNVDSGDIILEALKTVDPQWWNTKLDELTPLEFRVDVALGNPELRGKLTEFLKSQLSQ